MLDFNKGLLSFILILFLTACGGGGDDSSDNAAPTVVPPEPEPTPSFIIKNAEDFEQSEVKAASMQLVEERYSGLKTSASINSKISQETIHYLFDHEATNFPNIGNENFESLMDANGDIDTRVECDYQGYVVYKGKLNSSLQGNLSLTYNDCHQYENNYSITGNVAIIINELSESGSSKDYYFDNLTRIINDQIITLTGSYELTLENSTIFNTQNILVSIDDTQQLLLESEISIDYQEYPTITNLSGDLYIGNEGKITVSLDNVKGSPPYIIEGDLSLTGDKVAAFSFSNSFSNSFVIYSEDSDGDNVTDVGTYFTDIYEAIYNISPPKELFSLDTLSLPPYAGYPSRDYYIEYFATTAIEVSPGQYSDPDTAYEDLQISYRWYINEELVADQLTNIFPANIAVNGDQVKVTMVVFDGSNTIESQAVNFTIQDSPLQVKVTNQPDVINAGDVVQFEVEVYDPDLDSSEISSTFISGPDGATMDENGTVVWSTPTDLLFSYQNYEFVFGVPSDNAEINEQSSVFIKVESDKEFPIALSGMEVPKYDKSMFVGDFDGDAQNEILSTDGLSSVFLLEYDNGSYHKKWTYPYKMPSNGRVIQALAANIDDDAALEIIVVSGQGISVINGLNSIATLLFEVEDNITFATAKDIDGDNIAELAYLDSNSQVNVVSFNNVEQSLFSTSLSGAVQIEFANVDEDESFELITNNGLVYETSTWENQWFSGNSFGDSNITTGDYNNDGIVEIAGADRWGNISIFSAVDKSQLATFDNFNTCTLHSADVDNDGAEELLVGDCQWGAITAYQLIDNELVALWEANSQDHGSISLTSGDSDNDGKLELHWGSGISHSGEDIFVSADIDDGEITIKEGAISPQLDNYSSAGWTNLINSEEHAVFFIPSTGSGYDGSRVALIDNEGRLELSDEISSNWDNSSYAVTTDFNKDGFGDIFLPSTNLYDGSFSALQLNDMSMHWQSPSDFDSNIGIIKAKDINKDGFDDALYVDGRNLKSIDVQNQVLLFNYSFDNYIYDFNSAIINNTTSIFVSAGDKLHFLTMNGAVASEQSFISQSCSRVELINYDTDVDLELICLQGDYSNNQQLVIFELDNFTFTEVQRKVIDRGVIDIIVDPSKEQEQNIFITSREGDSYSYWDDNNSYQIKKMTHEGNIVWSSPNLVGEPSKYGLKVRHVEDGGLEMLLSTNHMMYWFK